MGCVPKFGNSDYLLYPLVTIHWINQRIVTLFCLVPYSLPTVEIFLKELCFPSLPVQPLFLKSLLRFVFSAA